MTPGPPREESRQMESSSPTTTVEITVRDDGDFSVDIHLSDVTGTPAAEEVDHDRPVGHTLELVGPGQQATLSREELTRFRDGINALLGSDFDTEAAARRLLSGIIEDAKRIAAEHDLSDEARRTSTVLAEIVAARAMQRDESGDDDKSFTEWIDLLHEHHVVVEAALENASACVHPSDPLAAYLRILREEAIRTITAHVALVEAVDERAEQS